ncbi:LysR family transcriptional regulator [Conyzicola sp.]|uniref:LysR family transcriptional regulator n=1 Tax=Conyzicola sp. TaxID=1969404 RepID=UPI003989CE31
MDTRQLEYFVAVAEELNFTRAAARMFAVQSTVSAGIRALETDLGTTLFVRSTKSVALSPAGELLLPEARLALEAIDRVRTASSSAGIRGRLRVGIFTNVGFVDLPGLFGEFHALHPLVDLQLGASASGSTGLADDVRRGRVDVAFMGLPIQDLAGLEVLTLAETRFVAVLPLGHPLAFRTSVTLRDLADQKFVDTPPGFGNRVVIERAFAEAGINRVVGTVVSDLTEVPRFVAADLGIAVVPELSLVTPPGTVALRLEPAVDWRLSVISRPNPSPAVAALLGLFADRVTSVSAG